MKYTLKQSKVKEYQGQIQKDNYGNTKYEIILEDEQGQLTQLNKSFKNEPKVGDILEGQIVDKEYQGNKYKAFEADKKSFGGYTDPTSFHVSYAKDIIVAMISNKMIEKDSIIEKWGALASASKVIYDKLQKGDIIKQPEKPDSSETKPTDQPPLEDDEEIKIEDIPF